MSASREIKESPLYQGTDEQIAYTLTTTPWGSTPTAVAVKLFRKETDGSYTDVSATLLSGSASVTGDVITCPIVTGLVMGVEYRLEIKFTTGGNVVEAWARVVCER